MSDESNALLQGDGKPNYQSTTDNIDDLKETLENDILKHQLAHSFYAERYYYCSSLPQAILSMLSGIFAFLSTSSFVKQITTDYLTTIAGCMSAITVFLQTLNGKNRYGEQAVMHEMLVINLRNLKNHVYFLSKTQQKDKSKAAKIEKPDESKDDETTKEGETGWDSYESVDRRYREFLNGCKSIVPIHVNDAFLCLESSLNIWMKSKQCETRNKGVQFKEEHERLYRSFAFDTLSTQILVSRGCGWHFPLCLPKSDRIIKETMDIIENNYRENFLPKSWKEGTGTDCFIHSPWKNGTDQDCFCHTTCKKGTNCFFCLPCFTRANSECDEDLERNGSSQA